MYTVKKITNDIVDREGNLHQSSKTIAKGTRAYTFSGNAWAILDEAGKVAFSDNPHGNRNFQVYSYKYVAEHAADCMNESAAENA